MGAIKLAAKALIVSRRWSVLTSTEWFVVTNMEVKICRALIVLAVILQNCCARIHKLEVKVRMFFVNCGCVFKCVGYITNFR